MVTKRDLLILLVAILLGLASRAVPSLYADWAFAHMARLQFDAQQAQPQARQAPKAETK